MHSSMVAPTKTLPRTDARLPKPPKPPEKPLMPYMRYSRKVWEKVKNENPQLKLWEVGRIIGQMWRELPDEEKNIFVEEYESEKQRYNEILRQYHSSPAYQAWVVAKERAERVIEEEERRCAARAREKYEPPVDLRESYILEDNEEDPDEQFTVKHVAAARFQRNHCLMHEILSDSKLPDPGQLITETRIQTLQMQVKQLKSHKKNLCSEIENCELRHQSKMRRIQDESAAFYTEYRKIMTRTPRISEFQFANMIVKARQDMDLEEEKKRDRLAAENEARKHRVQREAEMAEVERRRQAQLLQQQIQTASLVPHVSNGPPINDTIYAQAQQQAQYNRKLYHCPSTTVSQAYPPPPQYASAPPQSSPISTENVIKPDKNNNAVIEESAKIDVSASESCADFDDPNAKIMHDQQQQPSVAQSSATVMAGSSQAPPNYMMASNQQTLQQPPPSEYQYHQQQQQQLAAQPPMQSRYPPNYYAQGGRHPYPSYLTPQPQQIPPPPSYQTSQSQQMYPSWQGQYQQQSVYSGGSMMSPQRYSPSPHGGYHRPSYSETQVPPAPPPYQQQAPVMHHMHQQGYWQHQPDMPQHMPSSGHYPVSSTSADLQMRMMPQNQPSSLQQAAATPAGYYQGYGGAPPPPYGMPNSQSGVYFNGLPPQQQPMPPGGGYGHQAYMQPQQQHWSQQYPPGSYPSSQAPQRPSMSPQPGPPQPQPTPEMPHPPPPQQMHPLTAGGPGGGRVASPVDQSAMQRPSPTSQHPSATRTSPAPGQ